jgi:hypothetical protein
MWVLCRARPSHFACPRGDSRPPPGARCFSIVALSQTPSRTLTRFICPPFPRPNLSTLASTSLLFATRLPPHLPTNRCRNSASATKSTYDYGPLERLGPTHTQTPAHTPHRGLPHAEGYLVRRLLTHKPHHHHHHHHHRSSSRLSLRRVLRTHARPRRVATVPTVSSGARTTRARWRATRRRSICARRTRCCGGTDARRGTRKGGGRREREKERYRDIPR